jgi:hypothetical protein
MAKFRIVHLPSGEEIKEKRGEGKGSRSEAVEKP